MYEIPSEFFFRIHHIRPRFKGDIENVLIYMATEITSLKKTKNKDFRKELNRMIKLYPGNNSKELKTINNWRTEISALFGLIQYSDEDSLPGNMATLLADNQDLIEFFRYFLYYFQYPGGHLKPAETVKFIEAGIKFKPAKYLMSVLLKGQEINEGKFGITKAEATHCIFNDLRVTRDGRSPEETVRLILRNRKLEVEYDQSGDLIRYAGDILDYMSLADLVKFRPNYQYYLNTANLNTIQAFLEDNSYFPEYEGYYGKGKINAQEIATTQESWFNFVNRKLDSEIFEANILSLIEEIGEKTEEPKVTDLISEILRKIRIRQEAEKRLKTKEIGDVGETIVIEHEKVRITDLNRKDLIHLICKIPERFGVGYDIQSLEGNGNKRYIEVKTTVSKGSLMTNLFHMTTNEWNAANTLKESYFVYRLMISSEGVRLFLIQDPIAKYKNDLIEMTPRDGADIKYNKKSGTWEPLLV